MASKFGVKQWKWYFILPILAVAIIAMTFVLRENQSSEAASAQPQTTTSQCKSLGKLVESEPIMKGTTRLGEFDLYYNSSTGYNCVITRASNVTWGKAQSMHAWIASCKEKTPGNKACTKLDSALDNGPYTHQAGPVGVYGKGHCIAVVAAIGWHGEGYMASLKPYVSHC